MTKNSLKFTIATFLIALTIILSCNKNDLQQEHKNQRLSSLDLSGLDSIRSQPPKTTIPVNQPVKLYPSDADGNILSHKQLLALKKQASTLALCDGILLDEDSFSHWFKEVSYDFILCPGSGNPDVVINFKYEVEVPGNLLSSGNLATIQIASVPSESLPAIVKTVAPSFTLMSTRYDVSLGSDVNKYSVYFAFTMPYNTFCKYNNYRSKVKLSTDCEVIPSLTIPYQNDWLNFTPDAYQPAII